MNFFDMKQCNHILNTNNRLLDLVFVTNHSQCYVSRAGESLVPEDKHHPALDIDFKFLRYCPKNITSVNENEFNFKKSNFPLLYSLLYETNWSFLNDFVDVNEAVTKFYDALYEIFEKCVPKKRKPTTRTYPRWFNGQIIQELKQKTSAWERYKKSSTPKNYTGCLENGGLTLQ